MHCNVGNNERKLAFQKYRLEKVLVMIRSGIGLCAVDLPGHGQRRDPTLLRGERTLDVVERMTAEIDGIVEDLAGMGYEVSVASLRLDDLTPEFVFKLADTGVQGLTLAPECGSDRMRRILNKQFTNAEILDKASWIFENGIQNLKLYFMVGLPFETHADV